jgi:hypothetical protein
MPVNRYFNNSDFKRTQRVVEDIVIESIKIHGIDVYYLPKTFVNRDNLFGEDELKRFTTAAQIEVYVNDFQGFGGEGDILSKFGLEVRDQVTFTLARRRFEQMKSEKLLLENGSNLLQEEASTVKPHYRNNNNFSIKLESGTANGYSIPANRPEEGDLVFFPAANTLFEIKFVEHEKPFYQFGSLYTYEIQCERFEYSSENINTGYAEIDSLELNSSFAVNNFELLLEDGSKVLLENGSRVILEDFRLADYDATANNEYYSSETSNIVDWSEDNPFADLV